MKPIVNCPICGHHHNETIHQYHFLPKKIHLLAEPALPATISSDDERLWILFNKLAQTNEEVLLEMKYCNHCGFICASPRLTEEDIYIKYSTLDQLGFDKKRHLSSPSYNMDKRSQRVYNYCTSVVQDLKTSDSADILDYGGAEGELLLPFLDKGFKGYLADYIDYPNADERITYLGKDYNDIAADQKFDLILLLHTLEHVVNPVQLLEKLRSFLKPGGCIYVEVPLGAWLEWNNLREPLTHVNFFSEQSLTYCLEEAGLSVEAIESNWQWVTRSKTPCINIIGSNERKKRSIAVKSTKKQMHPFHCFFDALKTNPRYYGKLMLKSWLGVS
jgi:SAM-dependent methyltransferase